MRSDARARVAIVGAGFSGTMLSVHLRALGLDVTLIDRAERVAGGLAYSTAAPEHVLNVRTANMSALPDTPGHFADWLHRRGEGEGSTFASRLSYRAYLADAFLPEGASRIDDEAVAIDAGAVRLASGGRCEADAVVLALGNLPPEPMAAFANTRCFVSDPWSADGRAMIAHLADQDRDVLVVGTGLTMMDTVLSLDAHGFRGRIVATSRRGLLPRAHAAAHGSGHVSGQGPATLVPPASRHPIDLLRWVRGQARMHGWREVVDSLRPITIAIWRSWSHRERGSFLRHLRPWWDVHRHRIAPEVAARLETLIAEGRLTVRAGRIGGVAGQQVVFQPRGGVDPEQSTVAGVINCTGPQGDIRRSGNAMIRHLLGTRVARVDAFGLGLDVDDDCRVGSAGDMPLYAIGPMTRGAFWEVVAVPDIRVQAVRLANVIAHDLARYDVKLIERADA